MSNRRVEGTFQADPAFARELEEIEIRSTRSSYDLAPAALRERWGIACEQIGTATVCRVRGLSSTGLNRVIGMGLDRAVTPAQVDRILAAYQRDRIGRFSIEIVPHARPRNLARTLERLGFVRSAGGAKLFRPPAPLGPEPRGVRVERISREHASRWFDILAHVFPSMENRRDWYEARVGAPGWHHYVAYLGRTPAAIGALYVEDGAGELLEGVTLARYRRRGAQSALIHRRIREGIELGCDLITSGTSPPLPRRPQISFRNLQRAGFRHAYTRMQFLYRRPFTRRA